MAFVIYRQLVDDIKRKLIERNGEDIVTNIFAPPKANLRK